eukprot:TRINITY_DN13735_c0_g1_i1.p1 TRINITY_DN13735_c0_g1~~TRINITY_DN13735_c0_g1_i1.p1  ORF type:complete len:134 (+),score=17.82 TRINITY_DN13735_c0_g1_i1:1-402(+)
MCIRDSKKTTNMPFENIKLTNFSNPFKKHHDLSAPQTFNSEYMQKRIEEHNAGKEQRKEARDEIRRQQIAKDPEIQAYYMTRWQRFRSWPSRWRESHPCYCKCGWKGRTICVIFSVIIILLLVVLLPLITNVL